MWFSRLTVWSPAFQRRFEGSKQEEVFTFFELRREVGRIEQEVSTFLRGVLSTTVELKLPVRKTSGG